MKTKDVHSVEWTNRDGDGMRREKTSKNNIKEKRISESIKYFTAYEIGVG